MKLAVLTARILLGLLFLVFGLNGFLQFIHMPMPTGIAGQFAGALAASHYLSVVSGLQVITAALLLANRYVPLALTLLGPIIVNIILFHAFMAPEGLPMALFAAVLWFVVFAGVRSAFAGIFAAKVEV